MFIALTDEQKAHWGYLRKLHHTHAIAELSAELGRQRLAQLDLVFAQAHCNPAFNAASETARSLRIFELTRWQSREWRRVAEAQPWLVRVKALEPVALKVLDWPFQGGTSR